MSDCWRCQQKAEWRQAKLKSVRQQAKQQSVLTGKTMAIVQLSGCEYEIVEAIPALINVKEYVNANEGTASIL